LRERRRCEDEQERYESFHGVMNCGNELAIGRRLLAIVSQAPANNRQ